MKTEKILKIMYIIAWIIFLGLCVDAGGIICNTFITLVINPANANNMWLGVDISNLYNYDSGQFLVVGIFMTITSLLKAIMFYLIVAILYDKKLNMVQPFNAAVGRFIYLLAYLSLGIGLFSCWGVKYVEWLTKQRVNMPDVSHLRLGGGDVWLFMGVTLFVIALIFKRGIEISDEHELTV